MLFSSAVCAQTDLTGATVTLNPTAYDYDGTECKPKVSGIRKGTKRYNSLVEGVDYDISYENNVNAGEATATLTFKGDYTGIATKTFTINPLDLSNAIVLELSVTEVDYDGNEKTPSVSDLYYNEKLLVAGTDYDISYKNNTNPGTATVTATFKGNYTGKSEKPFTIKDSGLVPPSSLTVNYYDSSEANPQVEKEMSYDEFLTLRETFPNAIAISPQGFDVWPLDKMHIVVRGEGIGNNTCNNFTLTDKKDFYASTSFTAKSFSYTRELVEGYNTFCLPFSVGNADIPEGAQMYYFDGIAEMYNQLFFYPIQSGDAGYPFLMKVPTKPQDPWTVNLSNVRIEPTITNSSEANDGFYGTYVLTSDYKYADDNPFYGVRNSDNKFAPLANTLSPFRACVRGNDVNSSSARGYSIVLSNGITGVENVESQVSESQFNGKVFKDGRMIIFRNGAMFNAAGARIK